MHATNLCTHFGYEITIKKIVDRLYDAAYNVLVFTHQGGYVFDENQARTMDQKPLVILDSTEEGPPDSWQNTTILGRNLAFHHDESYKDEYMRLHEWVSKQNIVVYFKREYSMNIQQSQNQLGVDFPIYPIELLIDPVPIQPITKDQWMSRLGNVFHLYGYSNTDRKILHAALQIHHDTVINSLSLLEKAKKHGARFDLLEQVPYYVRYPNEQVYKAQNDFIFSASLPGYGVKCFRDTEACINAIPIIADMGMLRAVPFTDENALMLPTQDGRILVEEAVQIIDAALQDREALFSRAIAANEAARQLQVDYYVKQFINPHIKEHLYPRSTATISKIETLEAHIDQSIENALKQQSCMDPEVLGIKGFSTPTIRHLFNNLCSLPNATYLEVGAYYGGTACASISNNHSLNSIIVDNFSQPFGVVEPWPELLANLERFSVDPKQTQFINADCFGLTADDIKASVDIYFYDGHHDEQFQARALPHFLDSMNDVFIHIVDDYNWETVRKGTAQALKELEGKAMIERQWEFQTKGDDPVWHNGLLIAIMRKI